MPCSACATSSLQGFLRVLIKVEPRVSRPARDLNTYAVSRRRIHNSSVTCTQATSRENENCFTLEQASSTKLDEMYLAFDEEKVEPRPSKGNTIDARPRNLRPQSVFRSPARTIRDSMFYGQEHSPPTETSAENFLANGTKAQGSFTTKLSLPSPASRRAISTSKSAGGLAQQDDPTVKHGGNCTIQTPSATGIEAPPKNRDGKRAPSPNAPTLGKKAEVSSTTRRPKAAESNHTSVESDYRHREPWQIQKSALKAKFGPSGWSPRKRLSPDAIEGIRALHAQYPDKYPTPVLADQFQVSSEAVRRILKSKWRANEEEESERRQRWDKRGAAIWSRLVEIGIKPPKKWRDMGIGRGRNHLKVERGGYPRAVAWDSGNASAVGQETGQGATLSDRIL